MLPTVPCRTSWQSVQTLLVALATTFGLAGCVDINGGAAEFFWSIRTFDGDAPDNSCGQANLEKITLCWRAAKDLTNDNACENSTTFSCNEKHGATDFEITPGETGFWIEPICVGGSAAAPGTFQVPPPIVRNVTRGDIVGLTSLLLVAQGFEEVDSPCPAAGCTCAL